ncbi:MAG: dihydrofolate reductase [Bacteroidaceae bacterium]
MNITIIVAIAQDNAIGFENKLLFYVPADLKHFKNLTTGHTIMMGRKTFESLPKGALPNRRNIVLSRNGATFAEAETFPSIEEALTQCSADEEIYIIGGATVYKEALSLASRLCITQIAATAEYADAYFPAINPHEWKEVAREHHEPDEKNHYNYDFVDYEKR